MTSPSGSRERLGLLLGFIGMAIFGGTLPPPRALWPQLVITMLCVSILFPLLMSLGMQTVDASHGGVVLGILPVATALVAVAITHERPRPLFWIASVAGASLVIAFAL